jgi:fucose 4-O-acetylase-like acetyltransferase
VHGEVSLTAARASGIDARSPPDSAGQPGNGGRQAWLDAARGIGIILVVYAHGARALFGALPHLPAFQQLDLLIYSFHMPLFFFLAGLVSPHSLNRSRKRFLKGKISAVVYPYILWSFIYWILELMLANRVNTPLDPEAIIWIWVQPIEHLWFLYVLFLCHILAAIVWPRTFILVGICAWFLLGPLPAITVPEFWVQMPWFTAGLLLAPHGTQRELSLASRRRYALGIAFLCVVCTWVSFAIIPLSRLADFFLAGLGISLTVALAAAVSASRGIRYLGKASLSIYLLHTIFSAGAREVSEAFYPMNGLALLAFTIFTGLVAPLVVHDLAHRSGLAPYLGIGKAVSTGHKTAEVSGSL